MQLPAGAPWIAIQVRPKSAKTVAQHLEYRGYDCFLPMRNGVPLFAGYVFCRFNASAGAPIVTIPGVVRIVSFGGTPAHIEEREIDAIKRALASGQHIVPVDSYVPGTNVSISGGPLRGLRGTVLRVDDRQYLVVSITLLQRSVAVEVHPSWVHPDPANAPRRAAAIAPLAGATA
jgi:transcription antitermination factor NusG